MKKEASFKKAYSKFNIKRVAAYKEADRERLLADLGIIRNKLKVNAAIENAKAILLLQKECGSLKKWLEHHHPKTKSNVGKTIVATAIIDCIAVSPPYALIKANRRCMFSAVFPVRFLQK